MDPRIFGFVMVGFGLIFAVGLERLLARTHWLSLPIIYVGVGYAIFSLPLGMPDLNPVHDGFDAVTLELVTEFIVIVSLMAAGIAIDRPLNWSNWKQVWPLLAITMPLTIAGVALWGWWMMGLAPAAAILLGAALAPTDPVLARSVQVGPPGEKKRHDVRFSLTVEAGLNDGLAFPFTYLAIAAVSMTSIGGWTLQWFAVSGVWAIVAGVTVGWLVGRAGAWYVFERGADGVQDEEDVSIGDYNTSEGLIVLGTLLLAYGLAELIEGYGFIAVFVGAVTTRQRENKSRYHQISHHFIDQIEKIVLVMVLFAFGGMLAGGVLDGLNWPTAIMALLLIFLIRPLSGLLGESLNHLPFKGKLAVSFLGIRGMGSIYYLAYAQNHGEFGQLDMLWAGISFAILISIVVHGVTTTRFMRSVEDVGAHLHRGADEDIAYLTPDGLKASTDEERSGKD
ncbi:cation:proton antiporter [Altericroceibacterium endophyticum]|uniref:Sodium:proton antiporter n=1 Tax=Altericroceibacterium endophyticum TaxID=1808508 RepID=A0A6I4T934_9SPHN|nr:cation:proton antiporter [Altericroceibacterium endophyticum]MXO66563.1 sodium:proton antiporter [Altericroceibacterium endophyticum]